MWAARLARLSAGSRTTRRPPIATTGCRTCCPAPIADLDTRFFRSNENGRRQGGLFGLDGIHPTSSGYGIIAQEVIDVLAAAGVPAAPIDFAALLAADTLNSDPPALVDDVINLIAPFATRFLSRV